MLTRCEAKTMVLLDLATFTSQLSYNRRNLFKLTVYRVKKAFCNNCLERAGLCLRTVGLLAGYCTINSCQSADTSEIIKPFWAWFSPNRSKTAILIKNPASLRLKSKLEPQRSYIVRHHVAATVELPCDES